MNQDLYKQKTNTYKTHKPRSSKKIKASGKHLPIKIKKKKCLYCEDPKPQRDARNSSLKSKFSIKI